MLITLSGGGEATCFTVPDCAQLELVVFQVQCLMLVKKAADHLFHTDVR